MLSFLGLGLLVGLQHALEPDHLAAVGSLATRSRTPRALPWAGLFWGIGHAIPLLAVSGLALLAHATVPARFSTLAELGVGIMLVGLGSRVLLRLRRERVHLHLHRHEDGTVHLHAHSHQAGADHDHHEHVAGLPWSSTLVGAIHGLAGSAALVLLAGTTARSPWGSMAFVAVFSLGAMIGMAALGLIVSVPARWGTVPAHVRRASQLAVGCATVAIGLNLVRLTGGALFLGL